ncbi:MAG: histone deacetylase family protein [Thermodesulfobacteriota bacterium]
MKTAVFKDDLFLEHDPGSSHIESPRRLKVIYNRLNEEGGDFYYPGAEPAGQELLRLNHSSSYIHKIKATAGKTFSILDPDTCTSSRSYEAACLAAGAVVQGLKMLVDKKIDNGFALVRPPGHHAEAAAAMGFCLFNNIAIGARYALKHLGMERILIVDWDLHHGNGTQHSFYGTDQVLYFSTHQYPCYPGSGAIAELGNGMGEGFNLNVPLSGGQGDEEFARIFNELLVPLAREYSPDIILISAGFDIYRGDPLGAMRVTEAGFAYMTRVLMELAREVCAGRLFLTLEGGYDLKGMSDGILAVLKELSGIGFLNDSDLKRYRNSNVSLGILEKVQKVAENYWKL